MTYEKRQVHDIETGEIELIDLTPDEIAQRDTERAADEIELARPQPKSKIELLEDTIANLAQQVAELKKKVK